MKLDFLHVTFNIIFIIFTVCLTQELPTFDRSVRIRNNPENRIAWKVDEEVLYTCVNPDTDAFLNTNETVISIKCQNNYDWSVPRSRKCVKNSKSATLLYQTELLPIFRTMNKFEESII